MTFEELLQKELEKSKDITDESTDDHNSIIKSREKKKQLEIVQKRKQAEKEAIASRKKNYINPIAKKSTEKNDRKDKKYEYAPKQYGNKTLADTRELKVDKPKAKDKAKEDNSKSSPNFKARKYLERGKGVGGGKGNMQAPEKTISIPDKAVFKINETKEKSKAMSPASGKKLGLDEEADEYLDRCNEFLNDKTYDNSDDDSGSDIEIDVFQQLPLPIRGAINKAIQKKRTERRELRRDKEELKRWKKKLGYVAEDINNKVKDKIRRLGESSPTFVTFQEFDVEKNITKKTTNSSPIYSSSIYQRDNEAFRRTSK